MQNILKIIFLSSIVSFLLIIKPFNSAHPFVSTKSSLPTSSTSDASKKEIENVSNIKFKNHLSKENSKHALSYPADLSYGYIGISKEKPIDSPYDNVFHVRITEALPSDADAVLSYELNGVANQESIARSINESPALGGHMVILQNNWNTQKEIIPISLLHRGDNVIRFSLPADAMYHYEIKNVHILLRNNDNPEPSIILNQSNDNYYGDKIYLKGMISNLSNKKSELGGHTTLQCDGTTIPVEQGEFEAILPNKDGKPFVSTLTALLPNGEIITKNISFNHVSVPDQTYALEEKTSRIEKLYTPVHPFDLKLAGKNRASISIPSQALLQNKTISISALREVDLTVINPDLVNVTGGAKGYRFLPHGTIFKKSALINIPYDSTLIPEGYSPEDIRTYYFDDKKREWISLILDSIDLSTHTVSSQTMHFTDMIDAILKVPESPQTQGYAPTSIKDFNSANPSEGISMIAPPVANQHGNGMISFDLKLPTGRQGMEPNLSLQYSNEGGNGWMGLGWDLHIPNITIDTRWGVPRYDSLLETETYTMEGEQLTPTANRATFEGRAQADKEFYPRVEKNFDKIIRHGTSTKNYWWEVINKHGTRSFYGGLPEKGVVDMAVLRDRNNHISSWALVQTRDLDENSVQYFYTTVLDGGISGSDIKNGQQLYIDRINYTGTNSVPGPYTVKFFRDRDLPNFVKRKDVMIDGRLGYKMVSADLLKKITIRLNDQIIRSYELKYKEGAFYKTLLDSISELDDQGDLFYAHGFSYYDDVNSSSGFIPLGEEKEWKVGKDDIKGGLLNPIQGFADQTSALSTEKSTSGGFGLALTVGFTGDAWSKQFTVGGSFEFEHTSNEGAVCMIDVNGDELPDKVFKRNDSLYYRANIKNFSSFGPPRPILGEVNQFSTGSALNFGGGLQIVLFGGIFLGYDHSSTTSKTSTYFSDFNGDGLMDIASNGKVFFNHLNGNGDPVFEQNSTRTPVPLILGNGLDKSFLAPDTALQHRQEQQFPLQDIIRFWTAPFDGIIRIQAPVHLIQVPDSLRSKKADGVRVSVQLRDKNLWSESIAKNDFNIHSPSGIDNLVVKKGDHVYFRVQSVYNGENDEVDWDPTVEYVSNVQPEVDANHKRSARYQASEDYILSGAQQVGIPNDGTIKITGSFDKSVTSDTVALRIIRKDVQGNTSTILNKSYSPKSLIHTLLEDIVLQVRKGDALKFETHADSYIDRTALKWLPEYTITYQDSITNQPVSLNGTVVPENNAYNEWFIPTQVYTKNKEGDLRLYPDVSFNSDSSGQVVFTLKGSDTMFAKRTINVVKGKVINHPDTIVLNIPIGTVLYPEFNISSEALAINLKNHAIISKKDTTYTERDTTIKDSIVFKTINKVILDTLIAGIYTNSTRIQPAPIFRNWGQFTLTGDKGNGPMDETKLNFNEMQNIDYKKIFADTALYRQDRNSVKNIQNPAKSDFAPLYANASKYEWVGRDSSVFVSATHMSSSRLMMHDVSVDSMMVQNGSTLTAVDKIEQSEANTIAAGFAVSVSYSHVETTNMLDLMDINGDRFPDILHVDDVQYTFPNGGLEKSGRKNALKVTSSSGDSEGLNLGGKFPSATASNKRNSTASNANNNKTKSNARSAPGSASNSIGLSANLGFNQQSANASWIDINGDGLPDKVYQDGTVALNLGYTFTDPEQWNYKTIDESKSTSIGGGIGVNILAGTVEGGVGMTRSEDNTNTVLLDINGDGLPDKIFSDGVLKVQLNTGNGFQTAIPWNGLQKINQTLTTGESFNVAFTIPINIYIIGLKICINPSFHLGHGVSGQGDQILDINGDGFPDLVHSDNESNLKVRSSTIGRTNMLREVKRPMGSGFTMDYQQLGSTYDMPQNVWVLKGVSIYDGVPGDGVDTMRYSYQYTGGHYDRKEREFYGFDTVMTYQLNADQRNTVYRSDEDLYANENYFIKGSLKSHARYDASGNKFIQNINTYELKLIHDSVYFPALTQTKNLVFEGKPTAGASTYTQYEYDPLGNIIKITDIGDGSPQDQLTAEIKYHNNDPLYIKDIPSEIVVNTIEGVKRKRTSSIDAKGHTTQISRFLTNQIAAVDSFQYDAYGNLVKAIHPANYKGQKMFYEYTYDDIIHSYIIKTKDAYGYGDGKEYEFRFGNLIHSTSMQGEPIQYNIDNRGRIKSITGPYELAANKPYSISFDYHPEAQVPYAITHHYDPEYASDIDIISFMDGLGRPIQVKKSGSLFKGKDQEDDLKMIVSGAEIYDAFGRTIRSYYPTIEPISAANLKFSTSLGQFNESSTYDVMDRARTQVLADGSTDNLNYDVSNNLLLTQMIDALGNKSEIYNDVRSRKKSIRQFGGPDGTITTVYNYNALSELISTEDNNKNKIINTYDQFGRRLTLQHPDAGLTEFKYDLANNILEKITPQLRKELPNGGSIKYAYDFDRVTDIDYPIQYQNKISYSYGAPGSGDRTGRITLIKDGSGGRELYYGKLGEITKEIRTVLASSVFYTTYVSEQEYDTWNRIKKMTYPDGEEVSYHYNRAGELKRIDGIKTGNSYSYLTKIGYNEFDEKVYIKYGNGTEMNYVYDDQRRRLQLLQAITSKGNQMMNNAYTYDRVSNITGVLNNINPVQGKLGGKSGQEYKYDNLYRLISAQGAYTGFKDTTQYRLDMAYDNLFNITNKKLVKKDTASSYNQSYQYSPTNPHQIIQVGKNKSAYDLNGNLTEYGNTSYYWDEENRMIATTHNGILSEYTYDANDDRVIKSSGGIQGAWINGATAGTVNHKDNYTVYVSPYLVCRKTSFTKHIYMESERIASKIGEGSFTNISFPVSALTAGGINYIARANQLKQDRVNYYASLGVSPGPPTYKLYYAEPQNSGITPPILIDTTSPDIPPPGWPGNTTKPVNGPPIYVSPIPSNESVKAGYGFQSTGHFYESNQYYFHNDHLGSTSYLTNITGEAVQHLEYSAFGETFFEEKKSNTANPYLYGAKERDDETGLYYYGARYYNPVTSQWMSVDPDAENYAGKSPYSFVEDNPTNMIDPDGNEITWSKTLRYRNGMVRSTTIKYQVTGVIFSSAGVNHSRFELWKIKRNIQKGIREYISGTGNTNADGRVRWKASAKIKVVSTAQGNALKANNPQDLHLYEITTNANDLGNNADHVGFTKKSANGGYHIALKPNINNNDLPALGAHETFHSMLPEGLNDNGHQYDNHNLMNHDLNLARNARGKPTVNVNVNQIKQTLAHEHNREIE